MASKMVTIEIETEVFYEEERYLDGADADGHRGVLSTELIPTSVTVHTQVPLPVAAWAKVCAIDQFERSPAR